jgi:hypothetical protein
MKGEGGRPKKLTAKSPRTPSKKEIKPFDF